MKFLERLMVAVMLPGLAVGSIWCVSDPVSVTVNGVPQIDGAFFGFVVVVLLIGWAFSIAIMSLTFADLKNEASHQKKMRDIYQEHSERMQRHVNEIIGIAKESVRPVTQEDVDRLIDEV